MEIKVLLFFLVYFLPTLLASGRVRFVTFLTNVYLGWTVVGWIWALSLVAKDWRLHADRLRG
jgi:hypothetical protein